MLKINEEEGPGRPIASWNVVVIELPFREFY